MAPASRFRRLASFYAAYFLAVGIFLPFWPLWLDARGLSPVEIGIVLASAFWLKVAAEPVVARIADRTGRTRHLTTLLALLATAGFLVLSGVSGFWAILVLSAAIAVCHHPILPVMESVALSQAARHGYDYGRMRLWGSVSFVCATLGVGWLLDGKAADIVVFLMAAATCLIAVACFTAPQREGLAAGLRVNRRDLALLARRLALLVLIAGLIHGSHSVLHGFASLHWRSLGISELTIGMFWTIGVLAEILLFAVVGKAGLGAHHLLALAAIAGAVRWPILAVAETVPVILAAQVLHGATFGAAHLGVMAFLSRAIPPHLSATGQALYYALVAGVIGGCMLPVAGVLFDSLGADSFWAMGVLCACALPATRWLRRTGS